MKKNSLLIELFKYSCNCLGDVPFPDTIDISDEKYRHVMILAESCFSELKNEESISFLNLFLKHYSFLIEEKEVGLCMDYCFILCDFLYLIFESDDLWGEIEPVLLKDRAVNFYLNNKRISIYSETQFELINDTCLFLEESTKDNLSPNSLKLACSVLCSLINNLKKGDPYFVELTATISCESETLIDSIVYQGNGDIKLISSKLNFLCQSLQFILKANEEHVSEQNVIHKNL